MKIGTGDQYAAAWLTMGQSQFQSFANADDPGNGGCLISPNEVNQFRVPFLSPYLVSNGTDGSDPPYVTNTNMSFNPVAPNRTTCISRAGPDFQLFYPNRLYNRSAAFVTPSTLPIHTSPP